MDLNRIKLGTGDTIHRDLETASLVVISFSRESVKEGRIGDALDRLLALTDSHENIRKFANHVAIVFLGYDDDPREIAEIPECIAFFRTLTDAWPYWFHFLERQVSFGVMIQLLSEVKVRRRGGQLGQLEIEFNDIDGLAMTVYRLFDAMNTLHDMNDLDDDYNQHMTEDIFAALARTTPLR